MSERFAVGDRVQCKDQADAYWLNGVVEETAPALSVRIDGWDQAYTFAQVRTPQAAPDPEQRPAAEEEEERSCSICLCEFGNVEPVPLRNSNASTPGDAAVKLPCPGEHTFHKDCIVQWLRSHRNCPLCRAIVDEGGAGARPAPAVPFDDGLFDANGNFRSTREADALLGSLYVADTAVNCCICWYQISVIAPDVCSCAEAICTCGQQVCVGLGSGVCDLLAGVGADVYQVLAGIGACVSGVVDGAGGLITGKHHRPDAAKHCLQPHCATHPQGVDPSAAVVHHHAAAASSASSASVAASQHQPLVSAAAAATGHVSGHACVHGGGAHAILAAAAPAAAAHGSGCASALAVAATTAAPTCAGATVCFSGVLQHLRQRRRDRGTTGTPPAEGRALP